MGTDCEFDASRHIHQIHFYNARPQGGETATVAIDYLQRKVFVRWVDAISHRSDYKMIEVSDDAFGVLLRHSRVDAIRRFEALPCESLRILEIGYRDGWRLGYTYVARNAPLVSSGELGAIYEGSPLEALASWLRKRYPNVSVY